MCEVCDSVVTLSETVVDFTVGVGVSGLCLVRSENFRVSVGGSAGVRVRIPLPDVGL